MLGLTNRSAEMTPFEILSVVASTSLSSPTSIHLLPAFPALDIQPILIFVTMANPRPAPSDVQSQAEYVPPSKSLGKPFSKVDLDGHDLPPSPAPSSPRNGKRYALATELVYTEGTDQYNASSQPIYQVRVELYAYSH